MKRRELAIRVRGLTTLELLLAVAVTAIVALAISTVMSAVSSGLTESGEARSALQRIHAAHVRLRAYTDAALCVLAADDTKGVALWLHDEKEGERVNLTELRVLWFNDSEGTITVERVEFPDSWTQEMKDAADVELSPSADFFAEMELQRSLGYTETGTMADGIGDVTVNLSGMTAQESDRMRMNVMLNVGEDDQQEILLAFGLPNHTAPK